MLQETLASLVVKNNIVYLPNQLDRKLYLQVKEKLEFLGGTWKGGKVMGFVFPHDPTPYMQDIIDNHDVDLIKKYQFFPTPDSVADDMVLFAAIKPSMIVLEPSAGRASLIKAVRRDSDTYDNPIHYYEIIPVNRKIMNDLRLYNACEMGEDFLKASDIVQYDRIIANPPFRNNQDIDHIYKMFSLLKPGGRIVTLCSTHYRNCDNKKEKQFKNWLDEQRASIHKYDRGVFSESGTEVQVDLLIIDKE